MPSPTIAFLVGLVSLLWALTLESCTRAASSNRMTIAVVPMGTTDEYWKTVHAGAMKAAKELDVDILWKGPLRRDDRTSQVDIVENMIIREVAGIVLAPIDSTALRGVVENASRSNIPTVIIDSELKSKRPLSFIATNNFKGGEVGAKGLANLLQGKGRVIMLRFIEGNASANSREEGFLTEIKKYKDIEVVSSNQRSGGTTEEGYRASENLLAPFKTQDGINIDGIFCPNESTTFSMLRALEASGLAGKVKFVGFDSSAKLNQALFQGKISALVVQDPMQMAYLGVYAIVDHIKGKQVKSLVDTGVVLATPQNAREGRIHELLAPDLERWLK